MQLIICARSRGLGPGRAGGGRHLRGLLQEHHELVGVLGQAHAAPAAAGGGLDHDGEADGVGHLHRLRVVLDQAVAAGHRRHPRFLRAMRQSWLKTPMTSVLQRVPLVRAATLLVDEFFRFQASGRPFLTQIRLLEHAKNRNSVGSSGRLFS